VLVVDGIRLRHPHDCPVDHFVWIDQADVRALPDTQLDQLVVAHLPQAEVALSREVLQSEGHLPLVGHHLRRPVLIVLDPAE